MAVVLRKRPCRFCRRWFLPYAAQGARQRACSEPACQARRQEESRRVWLARHPGYFRGRATKHRQYRLEHPDVKRAWRSANPQAAKRERTARAQRRRRAPTRRAVEQEAWVLQLVDRQGVARPHAPAVEQEAWRSQLHVLVGLASALPPAVAQEPIAGALLAWNDLGHRLLSGALAREPVPAR